MTGLNARARKWGLFPGQPGGTGGPSLSSKPGQLCPCSHLATVTTAALGTHLSCFFLHLVTPKLCSNERVPWLLLENTLLAVGVAGFCGTRSCGSGERCRGTGVSGEAGQLGALLLAGQHPLIRVTHVCCPQTTMPGMKRDCGGAAAVLGAFRAAVKQVSGATSAAPGRRAPWVCPLWSLHSFSPGPPYWPCCISTARCLGAFVPLLSSYLVQQGLQDSPSLPQGSGLSWVMLFGAQRLSAISTLFHKGEVCKHHYLLGPSGAPKRLSPSYHCREPPVPTGAPVP